MKRTTWGADRTSFELEAAASTSTRSPLARPISASVPVTSLLKYTTTAEQPSVLDAEEVRNVITALHAESAKTTEDLR